METEAEYLRRKGREFELLNGLLDEPMSAVSVHGVQAVVQGKLALRARLLAQAFGGHPMLLETNIERDKRQTLGPWGLRYLYQRYELGIDGPSPYPCLRDDLAPALIQELHYFSSGMGAIAAVLMGLCRLCRVPPTVLALEDSYFETLQLLEWLPGSLRSRVLPCAERLAEACQAPRAAGEGPRVLLLDSIAAEDPSLVPGRLSPGAVDIVLYDSTCHEAGSDRVLAVAWAVDLLAVPVVMLRSHQKLDALGLEYGRMGSALFLTGPGHRAMLQDFVSRWATRSDKYAQVLGSALVPGFLPPFAGMPAFEELNRERIRHTVAANQRAAGRLARALPGLDLRTFHHGCFVTLRPPDPAGASKDALGATVMDLVALAAQRALPIRRATSFGFDFVALTVFPESGSDRSLLRVAFGDLPGSVVDACCELLVQGLVADG